MSKSFIIEDGIHKHVCKLRQEPDIISTYIYRGNMISLRRRIRTYLTIDEHHLLSKKVFKSSSAIAAEKAKHLYCHYYMIHPFSKFMTYWEFFMILVFFVEFLLTPLVISLVRYIIPIIVVKHLMDSICWIDIALRFITGYYDPVEQRVVLDFKRVSVRYLLHYFVFDVLSTLPWIIILMVYDEHFKWFIIRILMLLKLVRVATFLEYLTKFGEYRGYVSHKFRKFKLTLMFMFYVYWVSCILFLLANLKNYAWMPQDLRLMPAYALLHNCYKALLAMFLISYGDIPSDDQIDIFFNFICLSLGLVFLMYMMAEVLTIRNKSAISTDKYSHLIQQLEEYMDYKELPVNLRQRIHVYFEFRYQKHVYKESDLIGTMSPLLAKEILLDQCQKLMKKVDFFRDLPQSITHQLVQQLKPEIFLPNDIIVQAGVSGQHMYFIFTGTVAVYTSKGKELCHLTDGAHFGEISLLMNVVRTAYVVAVDACELFRLSRKDFQEAIEPYPDIVQGIHKIAEERLVDTIKKTEESDLEID